MKKFDAAKFYAEFRTGLYGAGWTDHDVAVCHEHVEALEATVSAALNVFAVTEARRSGWQLVPVEPTPAMIDAAGHACDGLNLADLGKIGKSQAKAWYRWRDMLAAAPQAPPSPRGALLDGDLAEQRKIHDQSLPQHDAGGKNG